MPVSEELETSPHAIIAVAPLHRPEQLIPRFELVEREPCNLGSKNDVQVIFVWCSLLRSRCCRCLLL